MFAWERAGAALQRATALDPSFTPEEASRLTDLQKRYRTQQYREHGLDARRLEFARWLIRTGRLSEDIAEEDIAESEESAA